jgi:hypothetical protein
MPETEIKAFCLLFHHPSGHLNIVPGPGAQVASRRKHFHILTPDHHETKESLESLKK